MVRRLGAIDRFLARYARTNLRGFGKLVKLFKGRASPTLCAVTTHGLVFKVSPFNYTDSFILKKGYYELEVLEAIRLHLNEDGVLWDVGANIGLHAITAKFLQPSAEVICFEPSPFTFGVLWRNASDNGVDLRLFNLALADASGYSSLSIKMDGNPGLTSFKPWPEIDYDTRLITWCDRAENLIAAGLVPEPSVVKVDVEGFETEVLRGFGRILEGPRLRAVIFEAHPAEIKEGRATALFELLEASGFAIEPLAPTNLHEKMEATNYIALKNTGHEA